MPIVVYQGHTVSTKSIEHAGICSSTQPSAHQPLTNGVLYGRPSTPSGAAMSILYYVTAAYGRQAPSGAGLGSPDKQEVPPTAHCWCFCCCC